MTDGERWSDLRSEGPAARCRTHSVWTSRSYSGGALSSPAQGSAHRGHYAQVDCVSRAVMRASLPHRFIAEAAESVETLLTFQGATLLYTVPNCGLELNSHRRAILLGGIKCVSSLALALGQGVPAHTCGV